GRDIARARIAAMAAHTPARPPVLRPWSFPHSRGSRHGRSRKRLASSPRLRLPVRRCLLVQERVPRRAPGRSARTGSQRLHPLPPGPITRTMRQPAARIPGVQMSTQATTFDLPVLPLRDVVVFPHMVIPLFVGRDKSIRALDVAMEGDKQVLLVAQKSAETDDPGADDLHPVGTLAQVLQLLKLPDGTIKVLVEGVQRVSVAAVREVDGVLVGTGTAMDPVDDREPREIEAIARSLMGLFEQYVKTNRKLPPELLQTLAGIDEPSRLADTVAAHLGVRLGEKQRLLETFGTAERLEMLVGLVDGEIDVQQMEKRIRGRVKGQMEKSQREYYLNEQM